LRVEVQQTFPLAQAVDAHRLLEGGHVRGKVVLTV
jgi:NADPH:quinone reductase-like Zn-dependent oxidoreductase